ncbi:MAG TPA: hypothetical protein VNU22_06575, partial [Candidatus Acidoferrum sp.]|nr:hypothetical protein [Candidatus Acidoferrum sp.]
LEAIDAVNDGERLAEYPFYYAARGELELRRKNNAIACEHFQTALALARNPVEQRFLKKRVDACELGSTLVSK